MLPRQVSLPDHKWCYACDRELHKSMFYRDASRWDNLDHKCRNCRRSSHKRYIDANPEKARSYKLKEACNKRGITIQYFEDLLDSQDHKCAICGKKERSSRISRLVIDHCHETGKVRGLLCSHCNRAIGLLGDSVSVLESAIEYLRKNS